MKSRQDLTDGKKKIEIFLTHLAVRENVAPAPQNQAMNALVFLYKKVLKQPLQNEINAAKEWGWQYAMTFLNTGKVKVAF